MSDDVLAEVLDLVRRVRSMVKAENIHARGVAKGGGESLTTSRDAADICLADLYAAWPAARLEHLITTLTASRSYSDEIEEGVTQEDRDAAAEHIATMQYPGSPYNRISLEDVKAGYLDHLHIVQAFRTHRVAALKTGERHG